MRVITDSVDPEVVVFDVVVVGATEHPTVWEHVVLQVELKEVFPETTVGEAAHWTEQSETVFVAHFPEDEDVGLLVGLLVGVLVGSPSGGSPEGPTVGM